MQRLPFTEKLRTVRYFYEYVRSIRRIATYSYVRGSVKEDAPLMNLFVLYSLSTPKSSFYSTSNRVNETL
jgi:hypothetical protein